jgi:hypothetical protein
MTFRIVEPEKAQPLRKLGTTGALILCLGIALTPFAPGTVAFAAGQAQDSARSDSEIQSDVAYVLTSAVELKGQHITAATIEGDVTLSGSVNDAASKQLAESVVSRINGVRSVTNNLTVGSAPEAQPDDQSQQAPNPPDQGEQGPPPDQNAQQGPPPPQGQDQGPPPQQYPGDNQANRYPPPPRQYPGDNQANGYPPPPRQYPGDNQANGYPPPPQDRQPYDRRGYGRGGYPPPPVQSSEPITIAAGTLLRVRSSETLDTRKLQPGAMFEVTAASDVYVGNVLAIPRGAALDGVVVDAKTPSGLKGSPSIALQLKSLNLGGRTYALDSDVWSTQGPGKGAYSAQNTIGGAAVGAIIGGIAGRGPGAAIGAAAGGGLGAAASAASSGPRLIIPAEAIVNFHLAQPVTVVPVSYQEAQRLADADQPRRPRLQQRAMYPYPPPPPYYYPYGYPYRRGYYYGW